MAKVKPGARECLIAPPGHCAVSVDFDSFELRTWSQVCLWILGYSEMANILNNAARCPHIEMGTRLWEGGSHFNANGSTWEQMYAWGYHVKKTDKDLIKKVRGNAKGPNFGLPGMMQWESLMDYCWQNYQVPLTPEQAQFACKVWREIYPEGQPYLDWVARKTGGFGKRGVLEHFASKRLRGDTGGPDGSNSLFQGLASDAAKAAGRALMIEAYSRPKSPFFGARPLAFIHDEWIFAVSTESAQKLHDAAYRMAEVQQQAAQVFCPDVTISCSPAAMFRWSKSGGDPYHNKSGLLVPFECHSGYSGPEVAEVHREAQERLAA
jgi:hypothetical protein